MMGTGKIDSTLVAEQGVYLYTYGVSHYDSKTGSLIFVPKERS